MRHLNSPADLRVVWRPIPVIAHHERCGSHTPQYPADEPWTTVRSPLWWSGLAILGSEPGQMGVVLREFDIPAGVGTAIHPSGGARV